MSNRHKKALDKIAKIHSEWDEAVLALLDAEEAGGTGDPNVKLASLAFGAMLKIRRVVEKESTP